MSKMVRRQVKWLAVGVVLGLGGFLGHVVKASGDFGVESRVTYVVQEDGKARVEQEVKITNLKTERYLREFSLKVEGKEVLAVAASDGEGEELVTGMSDTGEGKRLDIELPEVVGREKTQEIFLGYILGRVAEKQGEIWSLNLPRMETAVYDDLEVEVKIPMRLGRLAIADPEPTEIERGEEETVLRFDKQVVTESGITAVLGEMQVYDVEIVYHLENESGETELKEMVIPADSDGQRVMIEEMDPEPEGVETDEDGNWLAKYRLKSRERVEVKMKSQVEVFAKEKPVDWQSEGEMNEWLKADKFWEADSETIRKIAGEKKTARDIYDWVIEALDYDFNRVGSWEARQGALAALAHPQHAICSDYTDLFITVARAAGIPARQAIGYAYSTHPSLQPISLVKDVLHTWPEYWDKERGRWVAVDPTWGETTGGKDYFNHMDLNHVKLVSLGISSEWPVPPGAYKNSSSVSASSGGVTEEKDIIVSLGTENPGWGESRLEMSLGIPLEWPFGKMGGNLKVVNLARIATDQQSMNLVPEGVELESQKIELDRLPPMGEQKIELGIRPKGRGWQGAKVGVNLSSGEKYELKLPIWVHVAQMMILLGGGGIGGWILFRISRSLRSIRKATER